MEPIMAGFKHILKCFKMAGEKPVDPWLARIYYCLPLAGDKASASTLLYKPYSKGLSDLKQNGTRENFTKVHFLAQFCMPFHMV